MGLAFIPCDVLVADVVVVLLVSSRILIQTFKLLSFSLLHLLINVVVILNLFPLPRKLTLHALLFLEP